MDVGKLQEESTKKAQVEAHKGTFSRRDSLYNPGEIKTRLSRGFFQTGGAINEFSQQNLSSSNQGD